MIRSFTQSSYLNVITRKNIEKPGHHLVDVNVGELITNSWVVGSYVAVVSNPLMYVP